MKNQVRRRVQRAYTLIELMAVVALVSILAAMALVGYRRWLDYARTAETKDIVQMLALGQEQYFQDTDGYLDCSTNFTDYYPMPPNDRKHQFHDPGHGSYNCFRLLNSDADAPTYMSFIVKAGRPGQAIPGMPTVQQVSDHPPPLDRPWYIILAVGDRDLIGVKEYVYASSFQPGEMHVENEGE